MRVTAFAVLAAALAGCAAGITVTEIDSNLPGGSAIDGIPFRAPKRYVIRIYEKQESSYAPVGDPILQTLADPNRLYLLQFKGQALSSGSVDLQLYGDNTIQSVTVKSASNASGAISAVSTQLTAVAKAKEASDKAEADAAKTAATAETAATNAAAAASIAADKAQQAAQLAELNYQILLSNPDTKSADLLKAKLEERSKKLDANEAARLAGKPPYYPDVVP